MLLMVGELVIAVPLLSGIIIHRRRRFCHPAAGKSQGNCIVETVLPTPLYSHPLPSFPRKRESTGCLPGMRHHKAVPFRIPAYAGMTVGVRPHFRIPTYAGMTVWARQEGRFL